MSTPLHSVPTPEEMEEMEEIKQLIRAENEVKWTSGELRVKHDNRHGRSGPSQPRIPITYNFSSSRRNGRPY